MSFSAGVIWTAPPHFFQKYGSITVFLARLLPVVRTFIALPAGIARMPFVAIHLYTFLGSWPWCFVLAYVGMRLGRSWETDPRFKEVFLSLSPGCGGGVAGGHRVVRLVPLETQWRPNCFRAP